MKILLRPLCWLVGHLWEMEGEWPYLPAWICARCGFKTFDRPKEW